MLNSCELINDRENNLMKVQIKSHQSSHIVFECEQMLRVSHSGVL